MKARYIIKGYKLIETTTGVTVKLDTREKLISYCERHNLALSDCIELEVSACA